MRTKQTPRRSIVAASLPAGSLHRAVLLLQAIAGGSLKGSSLSQLVARTGLPRPTIHRVLNMLIAIGWVERDEQSARFKLGSDLAALGFSAISHQPIEQSAAMELSVLAENLRQVVYLSMRSGLDFVCIGRYDSEADIKVGKGWVGMRGPLGMTPACLGMLARLPDDEVQAIIRTNMSRYHRVEGFDETGFHASLAKSRERGLGIYDNILLDRTTSGLGVAICDPSGNPVAGIATTYITGWLDKQQREEYLHLMQQAAVNIAERLFVSGQN